DVIVVHSRRYCDLVTNLSGEVRRHEIHVICEIFPGAGDTLYLRLAAELSFSRDLASDARYFGCKGRQLVDHGVDGVLELEDFPLHIYRDLFGEVAVGHGGRDVGDITHLVGDGRAPRGDVIGKVLPSAGDTAHHGLAAELSVCTDFACHTRDFRCEGGELIHHGVDGVLQFEDFPLNIYGNFLGEIAACHCRRDFGDIAHLV